MQRRFRLHRTGDIQRVRRTGKSYAHPLLVLIAARSCEAGTRLAVTTGKRLGGAVVRNRTRRRIREAAGPHCRSLPGGWDFLLVARRGAASASFGDLCEAVRSLFARAGAARTDDASASRSG